MDKVHKGLMASILAASKPNADPPPAVTASDVATPEPPNSSMDPSYTEPPTVAALRQAFIDGEGANLPTLCSQLLARCEALERALLPFTLHGQMISNSRMCLTVAGRAAEPAGGVWLSQMDQIRMTPNEGIFYNAIDAVGRARAEAHMMEVFSKIREANDAGQEALAHMEAGGKLQ